MKKQICQNISLICGFLICIGILSYVSVQKSVGYHEPMITVQKYEKEPQLMSLLGKRVGSNQDSVKKFKKNIPEEEWENNLLESVSL